MSITRRQFLLGTTAGLILPSFYDKAFSYFENHGEPLLITPKSPVDTLYAYSEYTDPGFQLHLGAAEPDVPIGMTIRDFCLKYGKGDPASWWREHWLCEDDFSPIELDALMDPTDVAEWWYMTESPCAQAYQYLSMIDLGPRLTGAEAVGELDFYCGGAPGTSFLAVDAVDEVSLSLLQHRLNALGTGIKIELR